MAENIAVFGDSESIKGFAAVGLDIYPCDDKNEAAVLFRKILSSEQYAIIYVTEEMYIVIEKECKNYLYESMVSVVPIPGVKNNNKSGINRLSGFVEQAVGSDIIFKN